MTLNKPPRDKFGIALSAGEFRAALFHLGVLQRLAELDLLRFVEVLSTVSGGSIIGALYILLLKRKMEKPGKEVLKHQDYLLIVDDLEKRHPIFLRISTSIQTRKLACISCLNLLSSGHFWLGGIS